VRPEQRGQGRPSVANSRRLAKGRPLLIPQIPPTEFKKFETLRLFIVLCRFAYWQLTLGKSAPKVLRERFRDTNSAIERDRFQERN